jgi:hypothetical protein
MKLEVYVNYLQKETWTKKTRVGFPVLQENHSECTGNPGNTTSISSGTSGNYKIQLYR